MAKLDLKKTIRGITFFTKNLRFFGGKQRAGDQFVFDQRGAIRITDKSITQKNGEIIKIRGVVDAGRGTGVDSMVLSRPSSGNFVDTSRAMDANTNWVFACVKAIADELANIEFKVVKIKNGEQTIVDEHELLDFLEAVNDFQTGPEFKHTLSAHLDLCGNAYIFLEGVKDYNQKPTAMHLLNPACVKVILDKTTFPYRVLRYEFTYDSRKFPFQPYEIVHIKIPDPNNPYLGVGIVQGIAAWIDNDNNSTQFLTQFFGNGAQLGATFETEMTSEEQLEQLSASFNEQHSGVGNAYKALFLPKGVKKPVSDTKFGDIQLPSINDTNRDKILAGFRVSKTILGAAESDTNRATAETADYIFAKRTVSPKMKLICSFLNEFLVPRFGSDIFLSFVDPVPEDVVRKGLDMKNNVGALSTMTVNEAREKYLGLEPIEGGDKLLIPNNFTPATDAGKLFTFATEGKKKPVSNIKLGYAPTRVGKSKTQFARNAELRSEMSQQLSAKIAEVILSVKKKEIEDMTNEEYESVILKEKDERIVNHAKRMVEQLRKINNNQMAEVKENLSTAIKTVTKKGIEKKDIDPKKLFNLDKWINITISALTPIAMSMFKDEADQALKLIDQPGLDIENTPSAKRAVDNAMELMSESYNKDTVKILREKLNQGLGEGAGVEELGQLISDIYEWKNTYAAERVALTESNRITNTAGKIAWEESGVVAELKWVTSRRDNVCQYCAAMEGQTVAIDENFFDKGDEIRGDDGGVMEADYSDIGGPPLHPNCHCGIKPVRKRKGVDDGADSKELPTAKEIDDMDEALEAALVDEALKNLEDDEK